MGRERKTFVKRLAALLAVAPVVLLAACGSNTDTPTGPSQPLVVEDLVVGTGATAAVGNTLTVNYTGTFLDGTKFDSSLDPGRTPFSFVLGAGQVIAGWDQGLVGMKVGGRRKLTIPPELAYGSTGRGSIPPNTTLVFVVDLLSVS
jgi:FKBP-type peptidyl-prolyl cis-trans isomerase FkpA